MKIGVSLSGCDVGGAAAGCVLEELERQGLEIRVISACCIPAAAGLAYAYGCGTGPARDFFEDVQTGDMDTAVHTLSEKINIGGKPAGIPILVNAVDVSNGNVWAFTNDFSLDSRPIRSTAVDDPYDCLSATISPVDGLASYPFGGARLCDYQVWHGSPVHPLALLGVERVVSLAFLPEIPLTPHQALVKRMVGRETHGEQQITILFPPDVKTWEDTAAIAVSKIKSCINQMTEKLLCF